MGNSSKKVVKWSRAGVVEGNARQQARQKFFSFLPKEG